MDPQILQFLQLCKGRQVVQLLQAEIVQEVAGGAEQFRLAGHVAMTDDADPVAFVKGLDDVRIHGDAADLFDFAAGDRLSIGDERQRLEQRARIFRGSLLPQARHRLRHRRPDLYPVPAGYFHQFESAALIVGAQRLERGLDLDRVGAVALVEQRHEFVGGQGTAGRQQRGLDHIAYVLVVH